MLFTLKSFLLNHGFNEEEIGKIKHSCCKTSTVKVIDFDTGSLNFQNKIGVGKNLASVDALFFNKKNKTLYFIEMKDCELHKKRTGDDLKLYVEKIQKSRVIEEKIFGSYSVILAMIGYFDTIVVSSQRGSLFKVSGSDSTDTSILPLFPMSYATGIEPMVNTGNDVIYGRAGRIESVSTSDTYGDISTDDLSAPIKNDIATYSDWMSAYNSTTQKIYYYPIGSNHLWQYSKDKVDETSSWVKLTTNAPFNMAITAMMSMIDPVNNVEYTFIGDTNGKVYILEGDDGGLDAGQNSVNTFWRSGVLKPPNMYKASGFDGYISYRATEDTIITVRFIFGGSNSSISTHEVALKGASGGFYFGGEVYFGEEGVYFGSEFSGSFKRESIIPSGESEEIQIEISHNAEASFEINELGIRFTGQTSP